MSTVRPLTITRWAHLRDTAGERVTLAGGWPELVGHLAPFPVFQGEPPPHGEVVGPFHPGFSPAVFGPTGRAKTGAEQRADVHALTVLAFEQDDGPTAIAEVAYLLRLLGLAAFVYPTKSAIAGQGGRWRALVPTMRDMTPAEHRRAWHLLAVSLAFAGVPIARAERDAARFWWWPSVPSAAPWEPVTIEGQELDVDALPAPAPAPENARAPEGRPPPRAGTADVLDRAYAYAAATPGAIQGQDGSGAAIALAAHLVKGFLLPTSQALEVFRWWSREKCRPPWSEKEIRHKIEDAPNYQGVRWGQHLEERPARAHVPSRSSAVVIAEAAAPPPRPPAVLQQANGAPVSMPVPPPPPPTATSPEQPAAATPLPASGVRPAPPRPPLRIVQKDESAPAPAPGVRRFLRGDHLEIAQALIEHVQAAAPGSELVYDEGAMYRYDSAAGLWCELDKSTLARGVHTFAGSWVANAKKEDKALKINSGTVDGAIDQAQHIARRVDFFAQAPVGLAFADGFMRVGADGLSWEEHAPTHRARVGYPCPWATCSGAPCPRWIEFLEQVWPASDSSEEDQQAKIGLFQQFLGACLVGVATRYQICLVLVGEGSNGKSTAIKVAEALFPARSLAHVAPQDLGDEYRLALLAGKLLNTVGELPTSEIMTSDRFKAIVDGTEVTARHIRQEPITFHPRAGHLYAANKLPPVADMSHGFWSRFVVLRFSQVFERGTNGRELWRELVDAEGPAIIGWMLDGAAAVLAQRGYVMPPSSRVEIEAWRRRADTVAFFLDECCDLPGDGADPADFWEQANRLFAAYAQFAEEGKMKPVSVQTFKDRMGQLGHPRKRTATGGTYPVTLKRSFQWREKGSR